MNSVMLEQPSPPNQFFVNDNQQLTVPRPMLAEGDDEEGCEPIRYGAIKGLAENKIGRDEIATANGAQNKQSKNRWAMKLDRIFYSISKNAWGITTKINQVMTHILNLHMLRA